METATELTYAFVQTCFQCTVKEFVNKFYSDEGYKTCNTDQLVYPVALRINAIDFQTEVSVNETLCVL